MIKNSSKKNKDQNRIKKIKENKMLRDKTEKTN
jgi:hypothetical protein